jgi:hypothetical protein
LYADGLPTITAREENSGIEACVDVKPSSGLTDTEKETMLRDSIDHAGDDMNSRRGDKNLPACSLLPSYRCTCSGYPFSSNLDVGMMVSYHTQNIIIQLTPARLLPSMTVVQARHFLQSSVL